MQPCFVCVLSVWILQCFSAQHNGLQKTGIPAFCERSLFFNWELCQLGMFSFQCSLVWQCWTARYQMLPYYWLPYQILLDPG